MARIDGLLLDIDGVLAVSWVALPGAVEALANLRNDGVPFLLITNTTTHSRRDLAATLRDAGFAVERDDIVTAVTATAAYLRNHRPDGRVFVLTDGDPSDDLDGIKLVEAPEDADVLVLGGASDAFTYDTLNRVFRRLIDGAPLVGMHRNLFWKTAEGWELDGGAYMAALEEAAGVSATICGKPSAAFFESALRLLGVAASNAAMVGDDIVNDVEGARAAGLTGVLVRTGKFQESDLTKGIPDAVLDSFADVRSWLRRQA
jgi:HAD superfamily hydrolase (TIGR01458 family)